MRTQAVPKLKLRHPTGVGSAAARVEVAADARAAGAARVGVAAEARAVGAAPPQVRSVAAAEL